jgi:anaerobic magnesium-protoporphyrin IX monomethyl ester cyclase
MKAAGAHQVQIGIESGDPQLLANMNKACDVDANREALANCRRHNLTSVVSLVVGFPGETAASLERTYRFLEQTPPDFYFLATFSTRVAGVPLLQPENRRRFFLEVMPNLYSMAPYWRHGTMSCDEVGNHVRALDRRIMRNRVALNAALFYAGMLDYDPGQRSALLDFQRRVAQKHVLLRALFGLVHRWVDDHLRRDVARHFAVGMK